MINAIKNWFKYQKQKRDEYTSMQLKEDANNIIQVREYNRELWLTYNGHLICPMAMFKETEIDVVCEIRTLYIERNSSNV